MLYSLVSMQALCIYRLTGGCAFAAGVWTSICYVYYSFIFTINKGFFQEKKSTYFSKFLRSISILLRSVFCKILHLFYIFFLLFFFCIFTFLSFHRLKEVSFCLSSQYCFNMLSKISQNLFVGVATAFSIDRNANLLDLSLPSVWAGLEFSSCGQYNFIFKLLFLGEACLPNTTLWHRFQKTV